LEQQIYINTGFPQFVINQKFMDLYAKKMLDAKCNLLLSSLKSTQISLRYLVTVKYNIVKRLKYGIVFYIIVMSSVNTMLIYFRKNSINFFNAEITFFHEENII
jgi:hypothetical protein